ncbi:DinB family protein [Cytobacillus sp. IB215665]|uniref:DinB family protein n=1 Tax=Cytobacillus sp. IB215665 TaxID=3097357 RepID=UPI002A15EF3E|nr:DinB family protein [Cytobacillus sp. IB215665]MDX8365208.1 DinB family protein [Cytobacillus sp. IB215665]
MCKDYIIERKLMLTDWSQSLNNMSDELWLKPIKKGSWATADIISHFKLWDMFLIENRLSYLVRGEAFPKIEVDVEGMNKKASDYARSGISKNDLIDEFISVRKELVSIINHFPVEKFNQPCKGKEHLSLCDYLSSMVDHDIHHKKQIEDFLAMSL